MTAKELEMLGCRTFVCPNLSLIDEKGKELGLREETIKKAKDIAISYFKKTYHRPPYSSAKHLLPSFIYIASVVERERRTQTDIADVFGMSHSTIRKWYNGIIDALDIRIPEEEIKSKVSKRIDSDICQEFSNEINREGEELGLKDGTIEKAKDLALRYFEHASFDHYYSYIKQLPPAFIYTASIIENDRRTQMEVYMVSGVAESIISKWYGDILRILNMKLISHNNHMITVLERQDDD